MPPRPSYSASPNDFHPDKFKKETTARDYVTYAVLLVVFLGVAGGSYYYFTRPKAEQEKLRTRLEKTKNEVLLQDGKQPAETPPLPELKTPKQLNGLLDDGTASLPKNSSRRESTKPGDSVSTYAGGRQNSVQLSDDPRLPAAGIEFIEFVRSLKVSGVLQGESAKAMFNGRLFRAGAVVDLQMGVTFVSVDGDQKRILFRDKTGAELRLSY